MGGVVCRSRSADDTRAIGAALASVLRDGDVVVLDGDLGAGKTALVQGAARALGVTEQVTSPSFVLVRSYRGAHRIVHIDVYRLTALQELFDLGFEEVFDPGAITFIEWGEAVADELPEDAIRIRIRARGDEREITVDAGARALPLEAWAS